LSVTLILGFAVLCLLKAFLLRRLISLGLISASLLGLILAEELPMQLGIAAVPNTAAFFFNASLGLGFFSTALVLGQFPLPFLFLPLLLLSLNPLLFFLPLPLRLFLPSLLFFNTSAVFSLKLSLALGLGSLSLALFFSYLLLSDTFLLS
jgi:hypothetical protein